MHDLTTSVGEFLEAAAARQPTPGGGSVAALVGALAAAMGEMSVHYSVGKKSLTPEQGKELAAALGEFGRARTMMMELVVEDQSAYTALSEAQKKPAAGATDKAQAGAVAAAALEGARVPLALTAAAVATLELADRLAPIVNVYLLSDLAVCGELAMAAARCAVYNIRVNLPLVTNVNERTGIEQEGGRLLARASGFIQRLIPKIWERVRLGA